jgi:hypothetical protein
VRALHILDGLDGLKLLLLLAPPQRLESVKQMVEA